MNVEPLFLHVDKFSTLDELFQKYIKEYAQVTGAGTVATSPAYPFRALTLYSTYKVPQKDIEELHTALRQINSIAKDLFGTATADEQFQFGNHFRRLRDFVDSRQTELANEEEKDLIGRLLDRLDNVQKQLAYEDRTGTLDDLRAGLYFFLKQKEEPVPDWFVRNFEQIDGDVLRTHANPNARIYHYACLSDTDMADIRTIHSWPLDQDFFENALDPVDWKYRVYMRAKLEYRNFKRYALFYGLLFGAGEIRLSMIRNKDDEVNELYYLLRILNAKDDNSYIPETSEDYFRRTADIHFEVEYTPKEYDDIDLIKYRLCPARFLLETIGSGETVYKEKFLIMQYLKTLMEEKVMHNFSNKAFVEGMVEQYLEDELNSFESEYCDYLNYGEKMDIISSVVEKLRKDLKGRKFGSYSPKERFGFKLRKNLLISYINSSKEKNDLLRPVAKPIIDDYLNEETLHDEHYNAMLTGSVCEYCSQKQLCLEPYKIKPRKRK